ncbi:hypothetical protein FOA52_009514 [Chlamydomonas sp. UWO 241]|nr:hypothetical protein FOA52_009514 [Chlamydomonas sp. UWO 241]
MADGAVPARGGARTRVSRALSGAWRRVRTLGTSGARALGATGARLLPMGSQLGVSRVAYGTGMKCTQLLAWCVRASAATPLLAPVLGATGVAASAVAAGMASRKLRKRLLDDAPLALPTRKGTASALKRTRTKLASGARATVVAVRQPRALARDTWRAVRGIRAPRVTVDVASDALMGLLTFVLWKSR